MILKNLPLSLVNPLASWLWWQMWTPNPRNQKFKGSWRRRGSGAAFPHVPITSYPWVSCNRLAEVTEEILLKITYPLSKASCGSNQRARNRILRNILRHIVKDMGSKFQSPTGKPILSRIFCWPPTMSHARYLKNQTDRKMRLKENLKPPLWQILFTPLPLNREYYFSGRQFYFRPHFLSGDTLVPREHCVHFPLVWSKCNCNYLFMQLFGQTFYPQLNCNLQEGGNLVGLIEWDN